METKKKHQEDITQTSYVAPRISSKGTIDNLCGKLVNCVGIVHKPTSGAYIGVCKNVSRIADQD